MPSPSERNRLSALVVLALLSLSWLTYLLGVHRHVGGKLMEIALETGLLDEGEGLLKWVDGKEGKGKKEGDGKVLEGLILGDEDGPIESGAMFVVFGNSEVASGEAVGSKKKGKVKKPKNWVEVLCEESNCTSLLNFASYEPYISSPPAGSIISNSIYISSLTTHLQSKNITNPPPPPTLLDDLSMQIRTFLAQPPSSNPPQSTLFILNFGLWEIYHLASLDYEVAKNATDLMITELFAQLDILYSHYTENLSLYHSTQPPTPLQDGNIATVNTTIQTTTSPITKRPKFKLILPELFDPTLLPGWPSRPHPPPPDNSAEELRNGVHLTDRWNKALQKSVRTWAAPPDKPPLAPERGLLPPLKKRESKSLKEGARGSGSTVYIEKDVFFATATSYIMDNMINAHMRQQGVSDGKGLGSNVSVFQSVYESCVKEAVDGDKEGKSQDGRKLVDGRWTCANPDEYLFWDGWSLGQVAGAVFARGVHDLIKGPEGVTKD